MSRFFPRNRFHSFGAFLNRLLKERKDETVVRDRFVRRVPTDEREGGRNFSLSNSGVALGSLVAVPDATLACDDPATAGPEATAVAPVTALEW